jgi:hypothetical protein
MSVIFGFAIGACFFSTGLTIRLVKRIKDAKKREEIKAQNDWRYSRRPKDLRDIQELYSIDDAIRVFRQLRYNERPCAPHTDNRTETRAYKYLMESGHIIVNSSGLYTIYMFDNLKWKVYSSNNLVAVASIHEPAGNENWIYVNKDKDIRERVEQMLNRLIVLLRKTEQNFKIEDDKKFSAQKAMILGNVTRDYNASSIAALEAPSVITNVMSLTEKDALGIRLSSEN